MPFANVPFSLKDQLSSKSCGLVRNVCDTCFGLVCFTLNMFLHLMIFISASLAQ